MLRRLTDFAFHLVPKGVRRTLRRVAGDRLSNRISSGLKRHDSIYNTDYFAGIEETAVRSAAPMAESIIEYFEPASVLDIGCGTGALLHELRERGATVRGLEYSDAALAYCRRRGLDVAKFDLESPEAPLPGEVFDLAVSMEVAEHLPEKVADRFVDLLCQTAPQVVFTAATPGQGGADHVNEQPHQYWIDKFGARGYRFLPKPSLEFRSAWEHQDVAPWYVHNLMLFSRSSQDTP